MMAQIAAAPVGRVGHRVDGGPSGTSGARSAWFLLLFVVVSRMFRCELVRIGPDDLECGYGW
jgi:hypothetical protein